jgi:plastocyanin
MNRSAFLAALVLSTAACGSSSGPTGADNPPPSPAPGDIAIVPGASLLTTAAFNPNPKSVALGGAASVSVRWVNTDVTGGGGYGGGGGTATAHMIMSDDGAFTTSQLLGAADTYSIELTKAGTYKYHCAVHPNMVGTITVAP